MQSNTHLGRRKCTLSINTIGTWHAALSWFMDRPTRFKESYLPVKLAHLALTNNYVKCKELSFSVYQHVIGTAMETSFSVMYVASI